MGYIRFEGFTNRDAVANPLLEHWRRQLEEMYRMTSLVVGLGDGSVIENVVVKNDTMTGIGIDRRNSMITNEAARIEHVEDVWHPPPFEPRPDLVITPATDQTVRIKFDKREHQSSTPRELETETEVTIIISPLVPKETK